MSERDDYPAGVPCWVDTIQPDPKAATEFYGALFGWQWAAKPDGQYFEATLRGRNVAGVGARPKGMDMPAVWTTYVRVANIDETISKVDAAGGKLIDGPIDASPAGRVAVFVDPVGAPFGVWEAQTREGAQVVNESSAWAISTLQTTDVELSKSFYGEVFGWEFSAFGPVTVVQVPGYFGGEPSQPVPRDVVAAMTVAEAGVSPHWNVDFWTKDADGLAAKTTQLGGKVVNEPTDSPTFRTGLLADPQGATFTVSQLLQK